ncbi:MAG: hemolysin family protein [Chloroflexi bacterium]|nr:hemolysin family protein [Chloroflexota bacterium]
MEAGAGLLLVLLAALGIHAGVSLINAALHNVSRADMQKRAEDGDAAAQRFLSIIENSLHLSMTVSITHILTRFVIAVVLLLLLILPLALGAEVARLAPALATVLLGAGLTLIVGDLVPEAIGSSHADSLLRPSLAAMRLLLALVSPLTKLVLLLSRLISRLFGSEALVSLVTEEEIMSLVYASHSGGIIEEEEKDMIASVLQLGESSARELMTPRIDIVALEINDTIMDALTAFVESGFSRIPVYEESIDTVKGLLNAKDFLTVLKNRDDLESQEIRDLIRPTYFVPETKRADALLKELQEKNVHLAIVVDEYGGTSGLVTIEDLIEEIIGEIRDEYDVGEEEVYVEAGDGSYIIEASMDLDDLNVLLDCSIDTGAADTLGGYIYLALGRVPRANETIDTDILSMTVLSIDGHRIRKVRVRKIARESGAGEEAPRQGIVGGERVSAPGK